MPRCIFPPQHLCPEEKEKVFTIQSFPPTLKVQSILGFPGDSAVKNLPAMQETQEMQVQSLGGKDPLEESMTTHSSLLAWRIPWTKESGRLQSIGLQKVGHN